MQLKSALSIVMFISSSTLVSAGLPGIINSIWNDATSDAASAVASVVSDITGSASVQATSDSDYDYDTSLLALVAAVATAYPGFSTVSLPVEPTTGASLTAFATNPRSFLTARPTSWESNLPSTLRSQFDSFLTSGVYADASADRKSLGITATVVAATATAKGAAPSAGKDVWMAAAAVAGVAGVAGFVL